MDYFNHGICTGKKSKDGGGKKGKDVPLLSLSSSSLQLLAGSKKAEGKSSKTYEKGEKGQKEKAPDKSSKVKTEKSGKAKGDKSDSKVKSGKFARSHQSVFIDFANEFKQPGKREGIVSARNSFPVDKNSHSAIVRSGCVICSLVFSRGISGSTTFRI